MTQATSKLALFAFGFAISGPAVGVAQSLATDQIVPLTTWTYEPLYEDAISTDSLLYEMRVFGSDGEDIGDVENILFNPDGQVLAIVAEVGGFWDIGDTHVNIPWSEVEMRSEGDGITVPVTEATVDDYSLFAAEIVTEGTAEMINVVSEDLTTGDRVWRATELIGDYARLWSENTYVDYGYVTDIMIDDGQVAAVMVRPAGSMRTPGTYAYPYYGRPYGWTPEQTSYDLPYGPDDIGSVQPFDYNIYEQ